MSNHCVVAVYESFDEAKQAVQALEKSDFPSEQVSLVTHSVPEEVLQEEVLQYGDETEKDAVKGAGVGGLLGLLLGTPLLMIPGIGPVLIAGPLAAGLTGAIVGGLLGAMAGWGVHEDHVQQYEQEVKDGKLLVVANGDPRHTAEAQRVLREMNAEDIHLHAPISADAPEVDDS
ncbi:MAG: general stress protein [Pirellulaceae bacterium]